jgi:uncharacterized protein
MRDLRVAAKRIEIIDVLRGFTLLGIIIIHFSEQYYAGPAPQKFPNFNITFIADEILNSIIWILIGGKFFAIFSFLFGLSFFLQVGKAGEASTSAFRFLWRLIVLLAIGAIHHLHYRGDILTIYAMLGVGLLLIQRLPDKVLLIIAIILILNIPAHIVRGVKIFQSGTESLLSSFAGNDADNELYYKTVGTGSYVDVLRANAGEFDTKYKFQIESGRIYITFGLFMLGLFAGRKDFFTHIEEKIAWVKRLRKVTLWSLLGVVIFVGLLFGGAHLAKWQLPDAVQWSVGGFAYDAFNAALAVVYVTVIIQLFCIEKWRKRLMVFYEVGRMGLTTYITQTALGTTLFFGFGLGLLGNIGACLSVAIAIILFIFQIYISRWWLARFNYGPIEWLWRSLTYLRLQPFKKAE